MHVIHYCLTKKWTPKNITPLSGDALNNHCLCITLLEKKKDSWKRKWVIHVVDFMWFAGKGLLFCIV